MHSLSGIHARGLGLNRNCQVILYCLRTRPLRRRTANLLGVVTLDSSRPRNGEPVNAQQAVALTAAGGNGLPGRTRSGGANRRRPVGWVRTPRQMHLVNALCRLPGIRRKTRLRRAAYAIAPIGFRGQVRENYRVEISYA